MVTNVILNASHNALVRFYYHLWVRDIVVGSPQTFSEAIPRARLGESFGSCKVGFYFRSNRAEDLIETVSEFRFSSLAQAGSAKCLMYVCCLS